MVPLYVPAARPAVLTDTVAVDGAVPLAGETLSQVALSVADQVSVPPPVLLMLRLWFAGFGPAWTPVKVKLVGLRVITGVPAAVTVSVTDAVCVDAPGADTVMAAV
jgi:hypothetical protein